jgi:hypothetical protein
LIAQRVFSGARRFAHFLLLLGGVVVMPVLAQGAMVSEYAMKSTLLFRLPQFVYRPEQGREPLIDICLLGSNPFGGALDKLSQMTIDGRAVRYAKVASPAEAATCAYLFISRSESGNLDGILRRLSGTQVVTVSDIDGFARAGGMVEFAVGSESTAVSILINRKAAQRQSIEFNAQLLRLARVVEP